MRLASGEATLFERAEHGGTRVTAASGASVQTDARGRFEIRVPLSGTELRIERPGFATEVLSIRGVGDPEPITLFRGRKVVLPEDFVPVESEPVSGAGILLRDAAGGSVLVDARAGAVRMQQPPGWTPMLGGDGWVFGVDEVRGDVEALRLGDGESEPVEVERADGWQPRGVMRPVDEDGVLLWRLMPGDEEGRLQVSFWRPGVSPELLDGAVDDVGPRVRTETGEAVALRVDDDLVLWRPGLGAAALTRLPEEERIEFLFPDEWAPVDRICYRAGGRPDRTTWCHGVDGTGAEVEIPPTSEVAISLAEPTVVTWRLPESRRCRASLGRPGAMPTRPFDCENERIPAWASGDGAVAWDASGRVVRIGTSGLAELGVSTLISVHDSGAVALVDEDAWLTLVRPDDSRFRHEEPLSGVRSIWALSEAALGFDPTRAELSWVLSAGESGKARVPERAVSAVEDAEAAWIADTEVALAGRSGFVRIDRARGTVEYIHVRGWRWAGFTSLSDARWPDVGVYTSASAWRSVDLLSRQVDPLGEGAVGGVVEGIAWFASARGTYLVEDPGALVGRAPQGP